MRVALVTTGLGYGGAERIVQALAEDLVARGEEVVVLATTRGGPIADQLLARGIPVEVLGLRTALDARVALRLRRSLSRHRVDLVHSHLAVADIAVALATRGGPKRPLVSTVHNPGVELSRGKRLAWSLALRWFDRVLSVSEDTRAHLPGALASQVLHPSLVVAPRPAEDRARAREVLGLAPEARVVMSVGRLARVKGFDLLPAVCARTRRAELRFLLIGDGPERAALEGRGLELLGPRADAEFLLAAADLVVCPSRSEGFPQVPLHAAAAGVPVVATRVGGQPEVVLDGETGLLVAPEDPGALARAVERMFEQPSLRARMGETARARVVERGLLRATMFERTLEVYRAALGSRAPAKSLETTPGSG